MLSWRLRWGDETLAHMKKATIIYLLSNLVGFLLFYYFCHRIDQRILNDGGDEFEFGDALEFQATAFPVLVVCFVYSLIWAIKSGFDIFRRHNYQGLLALIIVVGSWVSLILIHRKMN